MGRDRKLMINVALPPDAINKIDVAGREIVN